MRPKQFSQFDGRCTLQWHCFLCPLLSLSLFLSPFLWVTASAPLVVKSPTGTQGKETVTVELSMGRKWTFFPFSPCPCLSHLLLLVFPGVSSPAANETFDVTSYIRKEREKGRKRTDNNIQSNAIVSDFWLLVYILHLTRWNLLSTSPACNESDPLYQSRVQL